MSNFYTETIKKDGGFNSANRVSDPMLLEPKTRSLVAQIIADAEHDGVHLMIFETYRSEARQLELFNAGKSKLKNVGVHHYGLACDLVRNVNGQPSWDGDFSVLGRLAHHHGLIWGADWGTPNEKHTFIDEYHVQRCTDRPAGAPVCRRMVPG